MSTVPDPALRPPRPIAAATTSQTSLSSRHPRRESEAGMRVPAVKADAVALWVAAREVEALVEMLDAALAAIATVRAMAGGRRRQ